MMGSYRLVEKIGKEINRMKGSNRFVEEMERKSIE